MAEQLILCNKKLYEKLFEAFSGEFGQHKLTSFPAMMGGQFSESEFKLMFVGRAVNGMDNDRLNAQLNANELVDATIERAKNFGMSDICEHPKQPGYNYNQSPFWQLCHRLMDKVEESYVKDSNMIWSDRIVWSNLFKVAPYSSGNPNNKTIKRQLNSCIEILKWEIDTAKPKHIVFVTDQWWMQPFDELPSFAKEFNITLENDTKGSVVGKGDYNGIKIVVVKRPESANMSRADQTNEILKAFE